MRRPLLDTLLCPACSKRHWALEVLGENEREIRQGRIQCLACGRVWDIDGGIVCLLGEPLPAEVIHEKEHAESFGYIVTESGEGHPINRETMQSFKHLFLSLPAGDGSRYFLPGGSFENQAGNAERFFKAVEFLKPSGTERVLEVGASFGWGAWRFAQRGCEVVALDVTHYLMVADLYMEEDGCYFERVISDMSHLPFEDGSFDLIFSHSVIHHCKDLADLFAEFRRVLRPGGRVVALHECAFGVFEDKSGKALQEAIDEGFNENAYTLPQWRKGARAGGFASVRFHFFSLVDDYIYRKEMRRARPTLKLKLAYAIRSRPRLNDWLNHLSAWPRVLLRPKAWMMVATKAGERGET